MNKNKWDEHIKRGTLPTGTWYYTPNLHEVKYPNVQVWYRDLLDISNMRLGFVCRTKAEAIKLAQRMLAVAKEER